MDERLRAWAQIQVIELLLIDTIARRFDNSEDLHRWADACASGATRKIGGRPPSIRNEAYEEELTRILARLRAHFAALRPD